MQSTNFFNSKSTANIPTLNAGDVYRHTSGSRVVSTSGIREINLHQIHQQCLVFTTAHMRTWQNHPFPVTEAELANIWKTHPDQGTKNQALGMMTLTSFLVQRVARILSTSNRCQTGSADLKLLTTIASAYTHEFTVGEPLSKYVLDCIEITRSLKSFRIGWRIKDRIAGSPLEKTRSITMAAIIDLDVETKYPKTGTGSRSNGSDAFYKMWFAVDASPIISVHAQLTEQYKQVTDDAAGKILNTKYKQFEYNGTLMSWVQGSVSRQTCAIYYDYDSDGNSLPQEFPMFKNAKRTLGNRFYSGQITFSLYTKLDRKTPSKAWLDSEILGSRIEKPVTDIKSVTQIGAMNLSTRVGFDETTSSNGMKYYLDQIMSAPPGPLPPPPATPGPISVNTPDLYYGTGSRALNQTPMFRTPHTAIQSQTQYQRPGQGVLNAAAAFLPSGTNPGPTRGQRLKTKLELLKRARASKARLLERKNALKAVQDRKAAELKKLRLDQLMAKTRSMRLSKAQTVAKPDLPGPMVDTHDQQDDLKTVPQDTKVTTEPGPNDEPKVVPEPVPEVVTEPEVESSTLNPETPVTNKPDVDVARASKPRSKKKSKKPANRN